MLGSRTRRRLISILLTGVSLVAMTGSVATPGDAPAARSVSGAQAGPVDGGGPVDLTLPPLDRGALGDPSTEPAPPGPARAAQASFVVTGSTGIPSTVLAAYRGAAAAVAGTDPGCRLQWPLLAAIGQIESGHARGGALRADGTTVSPILGPQLSGSGGFAAIHDTDNGRYDGDRVWDRAVGPMQFIPTSWAVYGRDGNRDGSSDPHNMYDAALAAATYLCAGDRDLSRPSALRSAVFGYNHSWAYVDAVLAWMRAYAAGGALATTPAPVTGDDSVLVASRSQRSTAAASRGGGGSEAPPGSAPSPTPNPTSSPPPSGAPTATPTPTSTPGPVPDPTSEPTSSPTGSPSPTCPSPSPSPTATPTPTPSPTQVDHATEATDDEVAPDGCPPPEQTPTPTPSAAPGS